MWQTGNNPEVDHEPAHLFNLAQNYQALNASDSEMGQPEQCLHIFGVSDGSEQKASFSSAMPVLVSAGRSFQLFPAESTADTAACKHARTGMPPHLHACLRKDTIAANSGSSSAFATTALYADTTSSPELRRHQLLIRLCGTLQGGTLQSRMLYAKTEATNAETFRTRSR